MLLSVIGDRDLVPLTVFVTPVGKVVIDTVLDDTPDIVGLTVGVLVQITDLEEVTELVDDLENIEDRETVRVRPEPDITGVPELLTDTELVFDLLGEPVNVPEPVLLLLTDELRVIVAQAVEDLDGLGLFVIVSIIVITLVTLGRHVRLFIELIDILGLMLPE